MGNISCHESQLSRQLNDVILEISNQLADSKTDVREKTRNLKKQKLALDSFRKQLIARELEVKKYIQKLEVNKKEQIESRKKEREEIKLMKKEIEKSRNEVEVARKEVEVGKEELNAQKAKFLEEKEALKLEKVEFSTDKSGFEAEKKCFMQEREVWNKEKEELKKQFVKGNSLKQQNINGSDNANKNNTNIGKDVDDRKERKNEKEEDLGINEKKNRNKKTISKSLSKKKLSENKFNKDENSIQDTRIKNIGQIEKFVYKKDASQDLIDL